MATAAELAHLQAVEAGRWMLFRRKFRPPQDQVLKAKISIQKAFGNRTRGLSILGTDLTEELEAKGHGRAAIQWALFDLVRAELILVDPPHGAKLEDGYKPGYSICAVGDAWKWTQSNLKKEFDPDATPPPVAASDAQLTVEKWSDLGIGIYQNMTYFGISPHPDNYAVFRLKSAKELPLRGRRWKVLLDLLARSESGNTANKRDVIQELGMFNPGNYPSVEESEIAENSGRLRLARTLNRELTKKIGDLARKLRNCVDGPDEEGSPAVLSAADETLVQSLFMVRHLVQGVDGKLHFDEERDNSRQPLRHISR